MILTRLLSVSNFALDGGAMFGVVPRTMWERIAEPDSKNRISMVTRVLVLLDSESGRAAVIDAGMGQGWDPKIKERFCVDDTKPGLCEFLKEIAVECEYVTCAILTHLHFDHAGGWVEKNESGTLTPIFQNAIHYVQKKQWTAALYPSQRDKGSFTAERFEPLAKADLLKTIEGSCDLPFGIELMVSDGHTPGLQIPIIRGKEDTIVFPSDLIPTAAHVNLPWIMAYDVEPLKTLKEKSELLSLAAKLDWTLVLQHDPKIAAIKVIHQNNGFGFIPCDLPETL